MDHPNNILFSDFFEINPKMLEEYGAFNISLLADLPLFIDPFLLFNSEEPLYIQLHNGIIRYLDFLRAKSAGRHVNAGLLKAWYMFTEVKQTWLGFTNKGNRGSGLGENFAVTLDANLERLFGDNGITRARHLEKLCLISEGVGRDNISDLTTNLIKGFLLEYTQTFATEHIRPEKRRCFHVPKARFNYATESWESLRCDLPRFRNDYVLLVPRDILTRDQTWINRTDLVVDFETLAAALPDAALRAQVNNFLLMALPENANATDRAEASRKAIRAFPATIDYYIRRKEDAGEQAAAISNEKVKRAESVFLDSFTRLAGRLRPRQRSTCIRRQPSTAPWSGATASNISWRRQAAGNASMTSKGAPSGRKRISPSRSASYG